MIMVELEFQEETSNRFLTQGRLISTRLRLRRGGGDNPLILELCPKPSFQCEEIFIPGWRTLFPDLGSKSDQVRNHKFLILNDH